MESWQQLVQLVERLPPDKAQKLRELLNSPDFKNVAAEGFAQIIRTLDLRSSDAGGPGPETLMRRVCKLLEPFLVNAAEEDEDGVIGRPTLMLWWKAAKAEMRHLGELERRFAETLGGGDEAAAAAIGVEAAEALARQALTLTIKNGPRTATQDVRRIAVALAGGAALLDDLERLGLSGPVTSRNRIAVSAPLLESFPGVYAKAAEMQRYDPVWLVHAAMNRLERPWEALLVVNAIHSAGAKGLRLEDTELAPVVQRVISLLRQLSDQSVAAIKSAARTPTTEKLRETEAITAKYFDAAEMITQQIKIERDSAWGRVFLLLRKTVSEVGRDGAGARRQCEGPARRCRGRSPGGLAGEGGPARLRYRDGRLRPPHAGPARPFHGTFRTGQGPVAGAEAALAGGVPVYLAAGAQPHMKADGSGGRVRTDDRSINSRLLYR